MWTLHPSNGRWAAGRTESFVLSPEILLPGCIYQWSVLQSGIIFSWDQHRLKRMPHLEAYERFFIISSLAKLQGIFYSGFFLNTSSVRILALSLHNYGQSTSVCRASVSLPVNVCLGRGGWGLVIICTVSSRVLGTEGCLQRMAIIFLFVHLIFSPSSNAYITVWNINFNPEIKEVKIHYMEKNCEHKWKKITKF